MKNRNVELYRSAITQAYIEGMSFDELNIINLHTKNGKQFDIAIQAQLRLKELKPTLPLKGVLL